MTRPVGHEITGTRSVRTSRAERWWWDSYAHHPRRGNATPRVTWGVPTQVPGWRGRDSIMGTRRRRCEGRRIRRAPAIASSPVMATARRGCQGLVFTLLRAFGGFGVWLFDLMLCCRSWFGCSEMVWHLWIGPCMHELLMDEV